MNAPHCPLDRGRWGNKLSSRLGTHGRSETQRLIALHSAKTGGLLLRSPTKRPSQKPSDAKMTASEPAAVK
jgi:hypothetical protein